MAIGRELVLLLHRMASQFRYFALAFAAQHIANRRQDGPQHHIHQVMAAHVEISRFGRHAQAHHLVAQRFVGGTCLWKSALQGRNLPIDTAAQVVDHAFGVIKLHFSHLNRARQVGKRKLGEKAVAIGPDIPHQEGVDDAREGREEGAEVENHPIVERGHDTHAVEHFGVALEVLNRIDKGVHHIGRSAHHLAGGRGALHEKIVVGVDTRDHVRPEPIGQGDFLATPQREARGEHHFKLHMGRGLAQGVAPKEDVVVAFDVGHGTRPRRTPFEPRGRGDVSRIQVRRETRHGR